MDTPKRPRGRPHKSPDEVLVQRSIRMPQHLWDKVDGAGLPALRNLLERWNVKPAIPKNEQGAEEHARKNQVARERAAR